MTSPSAVIRGGNLTNGFVDDRFVFVSETKANELRNANAFSRDIVITHRGTLGQIGLIPKACLFPRYVVSQSQLVITVDPEKSVARYVYEYLRSPVGMHAVLANTSQTGVPAIARPTTSLKAINLLAPPLAVLTEFERIVGVMAERDVQATQESRTLRSLRDALLPKLISGELRVKDAETVIASATSHV